MHMATSRWFARAPCRLAGALGIAWLAFSGSARADGAPAPARPPPALSADVLAALDRLQRQAIEALERLYSIQLSTYAQGNLGALPYYWQDPRNLSFNQLTYDWIGSALQPGTGVEVAALSGQPFTTLYQGVITKIGYCLSRTDSRRLQQARARSTREQTALIDVWRRVYGHVASTPGDAIDAIMSAVMRWATSPETTLMDLANARDMRALLGRAPASAAPMLPALAAYLGALDDGLSIQNDIASSNGKLADVRDAVSAPTARNGGVATNGSGAALPAFAMNTALADILNGLASSNAIHLSTALSGAAPSRSGQPKLEARPSRAPQAPPRAEPRPGAEPLLEPALQALLAQAQAVEVSMSFTGVTLVQFAPMAYDATRRVGWYWEEPVAGAIQNGNGSASGYCFQPLPQVDFSSTGPFGYANAAVISQYPTIHLRVRAAPASVQRFAQAVATSKRQEPDSLRLLPPGAVDGHSPGATSDIPAGSEIVIDLSPPPAQTAGTAIESRAWVLAVQTRHPGAR